MKTHLIHLEPFDDIVSVRDKMKWGKSGRILIIWPRSRDPLLNRRLDILLLRRQADELGAVLAFVSRDSQVKSYARELKIAVFKNTRQAQETRWPRHKPASIFHRSTQSYPGDPIGVPQDLHERREQVRQASPSQFTTVGPPWLEHPLARSAIFTLALMAVLAIGAALFPSARITLVPQQRTQELTFTAQTGPSIAVINPGGNIPSNTIRVIVEGSTTVESTGSIQFPDTAASGTAQFTNLTDVAVVIPAGTVLVAPQSSIRFVTLHSGQIPAQAGGSVDVEIQAVLPGRDGNLPPGSINAIEGDLGLQLTVTNRQATIGGRNQDLAAPTDEDRSRAIRELIDRLRETARAEIALQISEGDLLLTPAPLLSQTLEETHTPAGAEPSDILHTSMQLEFLALVVKRADLEELARRVLDSNLEPGFTPVAESIQVTNLGRPEADESGSARWPVQANRPIRALLAGTSPVSLILGQSPELAEQRLSAVFALAEPPEIELSPAWWPRLPFLGFRIEVLQSE